MTPTIEVLLNHRSIRQFTDEPIRDDQRQAIIASAQATSSSSFLQCTSIIRITDKAMREQLVGLTGHWPIIRNRAAVHHLPAVRH